MTWEQSETYQLSRNWNRYTKRRFDAGVPLCGGRIGDSLERDRNFRFWRRDVERNIGAADRTEPPTRNTPAQITRPFFLVRWFRYLLSLFGGRSK